MKTILILLLLVAVLYASGQDDPGFKSYMKAYENVLNGNWDESISQFESLIKQHPKSEYVDDAFFWIAYSKKEQNENEESMQLFLDFVKKYPKSNHVENANRNIRTLARTLSKAGKTKYSLYYNYGLNGNSVTVSSTFPMAELAAAQSIESSELAEKMTVLSQQVAEIAPVGDVAGVTWSLGDDDDNDEDKEEVKLQKQAVYALYSMKNDQAKSDLKRIISSDKALSVRRDALYYYSKLEDNIPELINMYNEAKDERLKKELIYSISKKATQHDADSKDAKLIEDFVMNIIKSENTSEDLKKQAIYRLRTLNSERAFEVYVDMMKATQNVGLKKELIYSMYKTNSPKKDQFLLNTAKNEKEDMQVRKSAIYYLGKSIDSFQAMKNLYIGLQNKDLKKEMIYSFSKLNTDESTDFLIQLLKVKNTDIDIRKNIIYYLGKSKDPKAQKAIRDILFE